MSEEILGSRYRLGGILGAGGMGVVWRAYDEVLDRQVAVKLLAPQYARDADSRRRTLAEARAAARLTHPHIASVYDYGESENVQGNLIPYVVMELLHGRSLHDRLQRGELSVEVSLRICAEVASALATAHAHGLVHRDVKPGNVMLTPGGAKVVDFGLAAVAGERDREEDANVLGTPAYLAPERLNGHPVVAATDVYALGLLLYRLLAGRLPWSAETSTQMLEAHVYLEPTPLPKLPGVPPVVRKLVHRCLAKEPAERPNSSEVTVTLAHAAGIHVPLGSDSDDREDDFDEEWSSSPSTSGSVGSGGRLSAPLVGVAAEDPYAVRLHKHLDPSLDHVTLRRQASMLLRGAVGFDLAIWAVLDPVTLMWASCVIDGGPHDERFEHELFANEYGQDDVLKLVDLTGDHRIGTIAGATGGDPLASRRFRNILQPRGFTDELRQTFYDENGTWGALLLYRAEGRFRNDDIAQVAAAGPSFGATLHQALERPDPGDPVAVPADAPVPAPAAEPAPPAGRSFRMPRLPRSGRTGGGTGDQGVRGTAKPTPSTPPPTPLPAAPRVAQIGALTISHEGRLLDVTADARSMLDAIELDRVGTAVARGRRSGLIDTSGGIRYDGRWLAFHTAREEAAIAVTVQRIRPHQISQFVTRALGLQPWHWRLLGAVARGRNTRQIAQDLQLSVYAVQDGMMALFTAFQVSGRIELLKTLFFEHYVPLHASDAVVTPTT